MTTQIYDLANKGFNWGVAYSIIDSNTGDIYTLGTKQTTHSNGKIIYKLYLFKYNEKTISYASSGPLNINDNDYIYDEELRYTSFFEINDVKFLGDYIYVCLGGMVETFTNNIVYIKNYLTIIRINTTDMTQNVVYNKTFVNDSTINYSIIGCMKIDPVLGFIGIYILYNNKLYSVDFTESDSNGYYVGTDNIIVNNLYISSDKITISSVKLIGDYIYYFVLGDNLKKVKIVDGTVVVGTVVVVFTPDSKNLYRDDYNKGTFITHKIYTDSQGYIYLKPSNQGNSSYGYWFTEDSESSKKYCYILSKDDMLLRKFIINDKYFYSDKSFFSSSITFIDGLIDNKNYCVIKYQYSNGSTYSGIYKFKSPLSTYSIMVKDLDSNKIYLNGYLTKNNATFMVEGIYDYSSPNNNLLNNKWQTFFPFGIYPSDQIIYDYLEKAKTSDTNIDKSIELCSISPKGIGLDSLPLFGSDNNRYCIAPFTLNGLRNYYKQYYLYYMPNTTYNIGFDVYNTLANVSVDIRPYPIKNILFKNVQINNFNGYYILADATKFDTLGNKVYDIVGLYDKNQFSVNLLRPDVFPFNTTSTFLNNNISYSFDSNGLPINSYTSTIANLLDLLNNHIYPIYSDLSGVIQDTYYGYNTSSIDSRVSVLLSLTDPINLGQTITEQIAKANFTKWYHFKLTTGGFVGSQVYIVYELFFNVTDIDSNGIGNIGVLYQNIAPFNDLLNDNLILYKGESISQSRKFNTRTLLMSNVNISSSVTSILGFNIINTQDSIARDCAFYNSNGSFIFSEKTVENTYVEKFSSSINLLNYNRSNGLYMEEMKWKNLNVTTTSGEFKGYFCYGTNSGDVFQVRDYNETTPTNLLVSGTGAIDLQTNDFSSTGITITGLGTLFTSSNSSNWTIATQTSV
jgi:hypothetical protein